MIVNRQTHKGCVSRVPYVSIWMYMDVQMMLYVEFSDFYVGLIIVRVFFSFRGSRKRVPLSYSLNTLTHHKPLCPPSVLGHNPSLKLEFYYLESY